MKKFFLICILVIISLNVFSEEKLFNPIFSKDAGFYNKEFYLELHSNAKDAKIFYTLDGTDPDPSSTTTYLYTKPILISKNTNKLEIEKIKTSPRWELPIGDVFKGVVVKAKTFCGNEESEIVVKSYFIGKKYTFPVISISLDTRMLFDKETGIYVPGIYYKDGNTWTGNYYKLDKELKAHFEFFEKGEIKYSDFVGFELSGNYSKSLPMKSIKITAKSKYGRKKIKYPVFPDLRDIIGNVINEYDKIILRNGGNSFNDIFIRDVICHEISKNMDFEKQAYRPVVYFINGVYWGISNMREKEDENYFENHYLTDDVSIIEISSDFSNGYNLYRGKEKDYQDFLNLRKFIIENDMSKKENYNYVIQKIDINSYYDYLIAEMFFDNRDWPGNNMKIWKKNKNYINIKGHDGKWRFVMYDMDNALYDYDSNMFIHVIEGNAKVKHPNPIWSTIMLKKLMENEEFKNGFLNRYMDHLNTTFLPERTNKIVDEIKGPYLNEYEEYSKRWNRDSKERWESHLEYTKYFLSERPKYVKKQLEDYFNVKIVNLNLTNFRGGKIIINDYAQFNGNQKLQYIKNIPIKLYAKNLNDYTFEYWVVNGEKYENSEIILIPEENMLITPIFKLKNEQNNYALYVILGALILGGIYFITNK